MSRRAGLGAEGSGLVGSGARDRGSRAPTPEPRAPFWSTVAACTASATAFGLYARVEWPWFALGWVGLVPWLAVLDRATSLRGALVVGLLMTELFTLAVFWWFIAAIAGYADAPWPVAFVVVLLAAPLMQPQFLAAAAARYLARRHGASRWQVATITATAYVAAEWALPKLFADTIGHGFLASRLLRQAADVVGAHGLTFLLLIANDCLLQCLPPLAGVARAAGSEKQTPAAPPPSWPSPAGGGRNVPAGALGLIVAALALYGGLRLRQLDTGEGDAIVVAAVQADISHYDRLAREIGTYDAVRLILGRHVELSDAALAGERPQLLVWPETVYPTTFGSPKSADGAAFDAEIREFVRQSGVPLVFGTYDSDGTREYNAAVALAPRSDAPPPTYRKAQLFPFTERVPSLLDTEAVRRRLPWLGTWRPGHGPRVLDVELADGRGLRLAPLICYDAVNPALAIDAVRQGAEMLVTLSNDSWFAHGGGPRLHLVVSAFRSIETRRPQVRTTNTGISALIDASGELVSTLGVHQRGVLVGGLAPGHRRTAMLLLGDWFGGAATAALAVLAIAVARRRRAAASV